MSVAFKWQIFKCNTRGVCFEWWV